MSTETRVSIAVSEGESAISVDATIITNPPVLLWRFKKFDSFRRLQTPETENQVMLPVTRLMTCSYGTHNAPILS